jgi:4-amino-4-deoxy-L-arabinose transferase-like glycosyltransferase
MFLIFGPSVITARLTVLLFALFGFYFWFRLVAFLRDEVTAAAATIVVAFLPSVLLYEKAAMLEIPAMAFCLAASYFWIRYLRDGAPRLVYWFSVLAGLAILSKAQTIYLGLWCLLSVIATGKWRLVWNRAILVGLTTCAVMVAPYYVLSFRFARSIAKANVLQGANLAAHPLLYYLQVIPGQIGWIILGLAILGIVT